MTESGCKKKKMISLQKEDFAFLEKLLKACGDFTFFLGQKWLHISIAHCHPKSLHIFIFRNQGNRNKFRKPISLRGWLLTLWTTSRPRRYGSPASENLAERPDSTFSLVWGQMHRRLHSPGLEEKTSAKYITKLHVSLEKDVRVFYLKLYFLRLCCPSVSWHRQL